MGANSFALKGWSVTLVSAILALSNKEPRVVMLAFIPVLIFWGLDAYYLALERGFSKLVTSFVNGSADAQDRQHQLVGGSVPTRHAVLLWGVDWPDRDPLRSVAGCSLESLRFQV
jgi:hypothetical protein